MSRPCTIARFILSLWLGCTSAAWAQDKSDEECFAAYEDTQVQLLASRFESARTRALTCASGCPTEITVQCDAWAKKAEQEAPSVLLLARNSDGSDAQDVIVEINGEPAELSRQLRLDPGKYQVKFYRDDGWSRVLTVTLHRGEKLRQFTARVPDPPMSEPVSKQEHQAPSVKPWIITSFAVGAAGFGVATVGTIIGLNKKSALEECAPECEPDDVNSAQTALTVADIGLAVGIVGAAVGVSLWIWGSPESDEPPRSSLLLAPNSGGGTAEFLYKF